MLYSAQKEGLLSETFHEETVQADPFYAHCKLHTDKTTLKYVIRVFYELKVTLFWLLYRRRKLNYLAHQRHLQWWVNRRSNSQDLLSSGQSEDVSLRRILRKLGRQRVKFHNKHWPRATWGNYALLSK